MAVLQVEQAHQQGVWQEHLLQTLQQQVIKMRVGMAHLGQRLQNTLITLQEELVLVIVKISLWLLVEMVLLVQNFGMEHHGQKLLTQQGQDKELIWVEDQL